MQKAGEESWGCRERAFFPVWQENPSPQHALKILSISHVQLSWKVSFHHSPLTSCHPFSKADGEIIFPLLFDVVILHSGGELTHSHFRIVTGSKAVKYKRPKYAALWTSSNPPTALLHSFLACNHLSPLLPVRTHRICSGGRPQRSQGVDPSDEGPKVEGVIPDWHQGNGAEIYISLRCLWELQCNTTFRAPQSEGQTGSHSHLLFSC